MALHKSTSLKGRAQSLYGKGSGLTKLPEYVSWYQLRKRCNNPKVPNYERYGGRGIRVCDRWESFQLFLEDMSKKPTPKHSIDRIDNDGNYCPENCRWATSKQQQNNSRANTILTFEGISLNVSQWAEKLGMHRHVIYRRLGLGWPVRRALSEPVRVVHSSAQDKS